MNSTVYAVGTMDTKGQEMEFVADCLRAAGVAVTTVDVGTDTPPGGQPDISREQVAAADPAHPGFPQGQDRGQAVTAMGLALRAFLVAESAAGRVAGVIGIGGSGGTALITAAMRSLPIGMPKMMVSTVASGNTANYVGCSDITMMYSVVDVAGLNQVSRRVLSNAAHAMAGMVAHSIPSESSQCTVGMTMFGVTTPCVTAVRQTLEERGMECLVFHATGTGGQAMEQLVESHMIQTVLDITTTEVADEVVGGNFPAGPDRMDKILRSRIPYVVSLGALDMVNFGARDTVPQQFTDRLLHVHNAQVTLMRTTAEENRQFARWICQKLNRAASPVILLIPEGGVSMLDAPGQPFYDPVADQALFDEIEKKLHQDELRTLVRVAHHINDPEFSTAIVEAMDQFHNDDH